jgi:hypothetical protein
MTQTTVISELDALVATLDGQRRHVLGILDGLSDEELRRPVLPSGWTCLGLVQHLALDVERFWFRAVVGGEQVELMDGVDAWHVAPEMLAGDVLDLYRNEIERANVIVARLTPESMPVWWPVEIFPDFPERPLRGTLLHVITETATHAGHLDIVRELIDRRQWFVIS